jgi:trehalose 6-phosphate phosphatase
MNEYGQCRPAGYAVSIPPEPGSPAGRRPDRKPEPRISRELLTDPPRAGLFLDFDGTLAPLASTVDDVEVPDSLRRSLAALAASLGTVAVISGRPAEFLARTLSIPGLMLVGVYGFEEWDDGGLRRDPAVEPWMNALASARDELARAIAGLEGVWLKDKGVSVVVHWRHAPDLGRADREMCALVAGAAERSGLRHVRSKWADELLPPAETNKGGVVRRMAARAGLNRLVYAGDDIGDLAAFDAVHELGGHAIAVAHSGELQAATPHELLSVADLVFSGPEEVGRWLERLAAALPGSAAGGAGPR